MFTCQVIFKYPKFDPADLTIVPSVSRPAGAGVAGHLVGAGPSVQAGEHRALVHILLAQRPPVAGRAHAAELGLAVTAGRTVPAVFASLKL